MGQNCGGARRLGRTHDRTASRSCGIVDAGRFYVPGGWRRALRGNVARAAALSLVLPFAGCSVGPNFLTPAAPVAAKWREARDASIKGDHGDYRHWWSVYRDPTLNRLVDIAYEQNLTLLEAGARVIEARASLGEAIGEFYPQTQQLSGTADYLQPSRNDPTTTPGELLSQAILAGQPGRAGRLGARLLGQVPPRRRIRRRRLSRLDRQLRRRARYADRRRRHRLHRHPHLAAADRDRAAKTSSSRRRRSRSRETASRAARLRNSIRFQAENVLGADRSGDPAAHRAIAAERRTRCASCSA